MNPTLPTDQDGKPLLWYMHLCGAITQGQAVSFAPEGWDSVRRRICLEMDFDYSQLFSGGKPMMFEGMRRKADTDFFMYGGLFDEFRGQTIPRNFFAGCKMKLGGIAWKEIVSEVVLILRSIDSRRWLWIEKESEPARVVELAKALKPDWIVFDAKETAAGNSQIFGAVSECKVHGARCWFNGHPSDLIGVCEPHSVYRCYRTPKGPNDP